MMYFDAYRWHLSFYLLFAVLFVAPSIVYGINTLLYPVSPVTRSWSVL